jgi:hypothetical protein
MPKPRKTERTLPVPDLHREIECQFCRESIERCTMAMLESNRRCCKRCKGWVSHYAKTPATVNR